MLHDKATISQSLARGFDLCGRREGGAAGGSAASWRAVRQDPALHSRAWTGCRAVSSTASRPSRDPVSGGRGEPAEAGERALLHPHNVPGAELLVLAAGSGSESGVRACVRDPAAGQRVSDTGRLQNLHRVAWGQGPAYLWTSLSVVVFLTRGPGRAFSERRAPPALSPQGADGAVEPLFFRALNPRGRWPC